MKNSTEVPNMVVTIKKPFSSKLKKITENLSIKSRFNIDLAPFFLWAQEFQGPSPPDFLPLQNSFEAADPTATPSPRIYITSQQAPAGVEEPICEGVNTRSPIIAQRRQKIAAKSVNCFFFFFCLEKKITLGFKDTVLKDDSMVVNIHVLHIRIFAPPHLHECLPPM